MTLWWANMSWWWRSLDCVDFFLWGVVHHPVTQSSAHGLFIFRKCMVPHLHFLLSLASQTLSQVEYLRDRCFCCASVYLGIPQQIYIYGNIYTYERERDAFWRCLALCSSTRQDQPRRPVEGLTSRTLLGECKRVPMSSLPHSLRAYYSPVREKRTAW